MIGVSNLRTLIRSILPHGIVDWYKKGRALDRVGYEGPFWNPWEIHRVWWSLQRANLMLLPAGGLSAIRTIVDVGAYDGSWARNVMRCVDPEKVIAVEPNPTVVRTLRQRFGDREEVEVHEVVPGAKRGDTTFHVTESSSLSSVLVPSDILSSTFGRDLTQVKSTVDRKVVPLDDLLGSMEEISLLRVGLRGYELPVLSGAEETLAKTSIVLVRLSYFKEYEDGSDLADVHQKLTEMGFRAYDASKPAFVHDRAVHSNAVYLNPRFW